jgi:hypothetical protein
MHSRNSLTLGRGAYYSMGIALGHSPFYSTGKGSGMGWPEWGGGMGWPEWGGLVPKRMGCDIFIGGGGGGWRFLFDTVGGVGLIIVGRNEVD